MKEVTIDYIFRTTSKILFKRLSTPSGLSEWFADDVMVKGDNYSFKWKDYSQEAKHVSDRKKLCVRFDWLDDDKEFLEFRIDESSMSKDITLYITDFVEDDEGEEEAREFWDNTINRFKRKLGIM